MMRKINLFILFLFVVQWSIAQKFYVQVAATTLPMGQSMEIMFTAENINSDDFQMPVLNDFTIVGGPSISQNTSIINTSILNRALGHIIFNQNIQVFVKFYPLH